MSLFERDQFMREMTSALAGARAGSGSIVLVCGEAGIGKTALVDRFAQEAVVAGCSCLRGACDAFFTPRVLGPLFDFARHAGGRFEETAQANPDRERLFSMLLNELHHSRGTAVIVEDVHWADEATLDMLRFLARRIREAAAVLVITYRDDELPPRHPLRALLGVLPPGITRRMPLPRLSRQVVADMALVSGRPSAGLYELTGGNPFFVTEVLAAGGVIPTSVSDAVYARAAHISPAGRETLDAVSLAPREIERWLLDVVVEPGTRGAEECLAAGILEVRGDALAFRHEIARIAWLETVGATRARTLHARLLHALLHGTERDVPMARVVHHAAGADDKETLSRVAPLAARESAQLGSHREAAAHYTTALAALAPDSPPPFKAELLEALTIESFLSDAPDAARDAATKARHIYAQLQDARGQSRSLRWLSRLAWYSGNRKALDDYAAAAVSILQADGPSAELAIAYSSCTVPVMYGGKRDKAVEWGEAAVRIAMEIGDEKSLVHALNSRGCIRIVSGDERGRQDLEQSLELALARQWPDDVARAVENLAELAVELRDTARADKYVEDAVHYCVGVELGPLAACSAGNRALYRLWRGDWAGAAEDAEFATSHPSARPLNLLRPLNVLGLLRARRGDPGVMSALDAAAATARAGGDLLWVAMSAAARAEAAWLSGRHEVVKQEVEAAYRLALTEQWPWRLGELAGWMAAAGELVPGEVISACAPPYAAQLRGDWKGAAAMWHGLGFPYERALALARTGETDDAREALTILLELGARRAAEAVTREMRERGVRQIPRGARPATRANPARLTPRQLRVLALLAEGFTNAEIGRRLFITAKTAEHHVGAILDKLAASSRTEAVRRARQLGLLTPQAPPVS